MPDELLPEYITKYNFSQNAIQRTLSEKQIASKVDNFNNLLLSSDVDKENIQDIEKYLLYAPLQKKGYHKDQVENFFDTEFSEFMDVDTDHASTELASSTSVDLDMMDEINEEISDQLLSEEIYKKQIDELSNALETELQKNVKFRENANQNFSSSRELIVAQRIQLKQGISESDFSDKFPFLPLSEIVDEGEKQVEIDAVDQFPYIGGVGS
jgi:hypothetical protein